jgi:protein-tyrosine phosphatase
MVSCQRAAVAAALPSVAEDFALVKPVTRVLFVCLGNICRSPAAEAVMRARAAAAGLACEAASAGTADWNVGRPPDRRTLAEAVRRGYDLAGIRARRVEPADFDRFALICAMEPANLAALTVLAPAAAHDRLHLLLDFAPAAGRRDVPDPYHGGVAEFRRMFDLIEQGVDGLVAALARP